MADQSFDSMFSQAAGTTPPASAPSVPTTPAPAQPQSQHDGSFDSMFNAAATGSGAVSNTNTSDDGTAPPSGGILQGLGESTSLNGVVPAIKAKYQQDKTENQGILDTYHNMIDAHRAGDTKSATGYAQQILGATTSKVLKDAFGPAREAAKMIFVDPINAIQQERDQMRQAGNGDIVQGASNQAKQIWDKAKQDWKDNNPDAALTDVASGVANHLNAIPLAGPAVSALASHLNEATHAPGGEDYGRVIGNTIGTIGTAALGPVLGKAGELLQGGSRAAEGLAAGEQGISAADTAANTAKLHDDILARNKSQFQTQLDDATSVAQSTRDQATEATRAANVETGNSNTERTTAHKEVITMARDAHHAAIDTALEKAKQDYANQFKQSLQTQSTGAAPPEDLAPEINKGIDKYEKKSHTDFEEGMNGEGGVIQQLEGHSEPVIGSPIQQKAAELLKKPTPGDHPLQLGAKNLAGVKLDSNVQKYLQNASEGMVEVEAPGPADEAGNPTTQLVKKPMGDLTADQLVGIRQNLREAATQFQRGDLNRRVIGSMIGSVDDTLEKLAQSADNPDVLHEYEGLRQQYKTARANLDTSAADKLRLDSPDKAMGDVNKYLLQGNNAVSKIRTIGSMVGDETMQGLRQSYIQQLSEMAPEDAMKALRKIPDNVKQEFFGPELDGRLQAAQSLYQKSVDAAEATAASTKETVSTAAEEAQGRNSAQATYDRQANTADTRKAMKDIADQYKEATDKAKEIAEQQNAPFSTKFASAISDGSIGDKLASGKIAHADVVSLKNALSEEDFDKIQKGIWNRAMADATTSGHFNPVQFLDWYNKIDPSVAVSMFSRPDESAAALQDVLSTIKDAATQQKLIRAGLATAGAGAGVAGISLAPGTLLSSVIEAASLLGAGAGLTKTKLIANLLDTVATNPTLIRRMAKAVNIASGAGEAISAAAKAVKAAPAVVPGFGRRVTVNGVPGTQVGTHPDSGKPLIMYHPGETQ